jgi:hypothetical protein
MVVKPFTKPQVICFTQIKSFESLSVFNSLFPICIYLIPSCTHLKSAQLLGASKPDKFKRIVKLVAKSVLYPSAALKLIKIYQQLENNSFFPLLRHLLATYFSIVEAAHEKRMYKDN